MILGTADIAAMKVGAGSVSKVYLGAEQVWPSGFDVLTLSPLMWLDASDASTLYNATSGGSLVAANGEALRWQDKSGNGWHMTQPSAGFGGIRRVGSRNGLDAVEIFGGAHMVSSLTVNRPYTIIFAATQLAFSGSSTRIVCDNNSVNSLISITRPSFCVFTGGLVRSAPLIASGDGTAVVAMRQSASAPTTLHMNGGSNIADGSPTSSNFGPEFRLGNGGENPNATIYEVIVTPSYLDDTALAEVTAYLLAKWAIS